MEFNKERFNELVEKYKMLDKNTLVELLAMRELENECKKDEVNINPSPWTNVPFPVGKPYNPYVPDIPDPITHPYIWYGTGTERYIPKYPFEVTCKADCGNGSSYTTKSTFTCCDDRFKQIDTEKEK